MIQTSGKHWTRAGTALLAALAVTAASTPAHSASHTSPLLKTRGPGLYVSTDAATGGRWSTLLIPGGGGSLSTHVTSTTEKVRAAFVDANLRVRYTQAGTGGFRPPATLSGPVENPSTDGVRVSASPTGWVAVGWNDVGSCWIRLRSPRGVWGRALRALTGNCYLAGVDVDTRGRLNLLASYQPVAGQDGILVHRTNQSGRWRQQRLGPATDALLTRDRQTGTLVAVTVPYDIELAGTVRIAAKPVRATSFGPWSTIGRGVRATSVTSSGGKITVAAQRTRQDGEFTNTTGVYVSRGSDPSRMGSLRRVPGTLDRDQNPKVSANARGQLVVAWQRMLPTDFSARRQGLWSSMAQVDCNGALRYRAPVQRTNSALDDLVDVSLDAHGHLYLSHSRRIG